MRPIGVVVVLLLCGVGFMFRSLLTAAPKHAKTPLVSSRGEQEVISEDRVREVHAAWREALARQKAADEAEAPSLVPVGAGDAGATTHPPSQVAMARTNREMRDSLVEKWRGESIDPAWTGETKADAEDVLDDVGVGRDSLRRVDCRVSLCRLGFHFASTDQALALRRLAPVSDDELLVVVDDHDYDVYLARPGQRIRDVGAAPH